MRGVTNWLIMRDQASANWNIMLERVRDYIKECDNCHSFVGGAGGVVVCAVGSRTRVAGFKSR